MLLCDESPCPELSDFAAARQRNWSFLAFLMPIIVQGFLDGTGVHDSKGIF